MIVPVYIYVFSFRFPRECGFTFWKRDGILVCLFKVISSYFPITFPVDVSGIGKIDKIVSVTKMLVP